MNLKKVIIIIFGIMFIFLLGIYGGYTLFKESSNNVVNDNKVNNKDSHTSVDSNKIDNILDNPVQDVVQLTLNKEKANESLYKFLYHLEEAYIRIDKELNTYIVNHSKILNDSTERLYFAFSYATTLDNVSVIKNINVDGVSEEGFFGVGKNDLIKLYNDLFDEDFNRLYNLKEKDNIIYGKLSKAHSDSGVILKANNFVRKGDVLTLYIDYLNVDITDNNYIEINKYSTIEYDKSYVKYKLLMNLKKVDDNYSIIDIKVTK